MGTRADFYVGEGTSAEWLGSTAFDGYPGGIEESVLRATSEAEFRAEVACRLLARNDGTVPADGWPWPWEDSTLTDYAYAFTGGKVIKYKFGRLFAGDDWDESDEDRGSPKAAFPDMSAVKNVTFGRRSGLIVAGF